MRDASVNAGLCASEDLTIAHEPEAASLEVAQEATKLRLGLGLGEKFMVVDLGGGTVDISVSSINPSDEMQVTPHTSPKGDEWGSTAIDRQFEKWLEAEFLGKNAFDKMRAGPAWMRIKQSWEV